MDRLAHEEEILIAAEKLFSRDGYDKATIDEIAKEARFTRRTLYQYFANKEDLYYGVAAKGFKKLHAYFSEAIAEGKNGLDKLRLAETAYFRFYRDNPDSFRLMNYIGYVKADASLQLKRKELMKLDRALLDALAEIIEEGKRDGSLRPDLDSAQSSYAMVFLATGFIQQVAMAGQSFTARLSLDLDEFIEYCLGLVREGFRSK